MLIKEEDRNRVLLSLVFIERQPKVNSLNNLCTRSTKAARTERHRVQVR